VGMAQAGPALRVFLATTNLPATCTLTGLGAVEADFPYYLGLLGMPGTIAANFAVLECDLLFAVGARFDDVVNGLLNNLAPEDSVLLIDIVAAEM
ncbi:acetolactate synthase large subunit, partial [Escherichia coli]